VLIGQVLATTLVSGSVLAQQNINNGEDATRPLARFDLKYQYQNLPPSDGDNSQIITLRADKPLALARDWQLATRLDLPTWITDAVSSDNPNGNTAVGLGDLLIQGLIVHAPPASRFGWAAGARLVLPTASEDQMGLGKWRVVSTIGGRYFMPEITEGSWVALVTRYDADVAGDSARAHISELQLAPQFYLQLPKTWFVNLYPVTDIRYNFADKRSGDTGRWFVPLDVAGGKMLTRSIITSIEISVPVVNEYKLYDLKIEARIGFLF
jgi:hypothetical protein